MTEEEVKELRGILTDLSSSCHTVFTNLYGDPKYPGLNGDIKEIKDHLKQINGRLNKGDDRMDAIEDVQADYIYRWKWEKWAIVIGISGGTVGWLDYVDVVDLGSIIVKFLGG